MLSVVGTSHKRYWVSSPPHDPSRGTAPVFTALILSLSSPLYPSQQNTGEHGAHSDTCWLALRVRCLQTWSRGGPPPLPGPPAPSSCRHPGVQGPLHTWASCCPARALPPFLGLGLGKFTDSEACVLALPLANWANLAKSYDVSLETRLTAQGSMRTAGDGEWKLRSERSLPGTSGHSCLRG